MDCALFFHGDKDASPLRPGIFGKAPQIQQQIRVGELFFNHYLGMEKRSVAECDYQVFHYLN